MTSTTRFAWLLAALTCVAVLTGSREAQSQTFDITGVWRDENASTDDATTPEKEALGGGAPAFSDNFHGTYQSRPYLLITLQDKTKPTGPFFLYSDVGNLRAELRPTAGAPNTLDVVDRRSSKKLGVLRINADECDDVSPCFVIEASGDLGVPAVYDGRPVLYVPVGAYDTAQDPKLDQTFSDMFSPLAANFSYILKCWHLARMDTANYQVPGCGKNVFAMPAPDSYGYNKVGFNNWHNGAVPFAWTYVSTLFQNGEDRGHTWENGQDVAAADSLKVGVKASVNIMGVEASSHVSVATQSKIENMYNSQLTYSKAEYLVTQFAFVLHKFYASLDPDLVARIQRIKALPESRRAAEYDRFVDDYGTHFANAITFGAKGERLLRMTQTQVLAMNESQTDVSVGLTAGYMGNTASVDVDTSRQNMEKITKNTSSQDRTWFCYSGGSCNDGIPSGDSALPVQLDLRPVSDLLAPPFFTDDEIITTMRDGVSRAIAKQAFVKRDDLQQPSAVFATVTGFSRHNLTAIGRDIESTKFADADCGASTACNDGTVTLTATDGSLTQISGAFAQPPSWRIPATLDARRSPPDGLVTASYTWAGKCMNSAANWTAPDSATAFVRLPGLQVKPGVTSGISFVTSPNCVTRDNPLGLVTVLTPSTITEVKSARSLLEQP